ncbi:MAG: M56 family metallopeptidase [Bacteroidaceae bacterium]|nr:M56 family metallopeptidase [Bacteroidaceae bacterium]
MGAFFVYILKSAVCLVVSYLFYRLLLNRETIWRFNRFLLLSLLALSFVLPLIQVHTSKPVQVNTALVYAEDWFIDEVEAQPTDAIVPTNPSFTWTQGVVLVYMLGVLGMLVFNMASLWQIRGLLHQGKKVKMPDGYTQEDVKLVVLPGNVSPFSWMHYIFISEEDYQQPREILIHECAHLAHRHSWDLLFCELCLCLQWFNPAAWLAKQDLMTLHEYEADDAVLSAGINAQQYQMMLIRKAVGTRLVSIANSLNQSNLQRRIVMMLRPKSGKWTVLRSLFVLPLAVVAIAAFARPEVKSASQDLEAVQLNDILPDTPPLEEPAPQINPEDTVIYQVVQSMPEFPGGMVELMNYISSNVRYPADALAAGIEGRVTTMFIIERDGTLSNVQILRGINPSLDAEALRVIRSMPTWKPGYQNDKPVRTRYTVPVNFRIQSSEKTSQINPPYIDENGIYQVVEKMPEFPGGVQALMSYIKDNLRYPEDAKAAGIKGRVTVQFVVNKDGSISNIYKLRGVEPSLDAEALRIVASMPTWSPGIQDGEAVAVRYTVPITFRL